MTSKKSKQHNVFEAEEQIWRSELVKFICPTTCEWETTYTSTSLEKRCYAPQSSQSSSYVLSFKSYGPKHAFAQWQRTQCPCR